MAPEKENNKTVASVRSRPSAVMTYFYTNLVFWALLVVAWSFSYYFICGGVWDDIASGMTEFLFLLVGGGFTLVSLLDLIYDSYFRPPTGENKK